MIFDPCGRFSAKLSAYLDGELAPGARAAVEAHLAGCGACAGELRRLAAADAAVARLPRAEPSQYFTARVTAAARALNAARAPYRGFLRLTVPAMAVMVTFILLNLFTFAFNSNAMENGSRRSLARRMVEQLEQPASLLNPLALSRLCGECSRYVCLCAHEPGLRNTCPCKNCPMKKAADAAAAREGNHVK